MSLPMVATQPCLLPTGDALGGLQWAWLPLGSLRRAPGPPEPREEEQPEGLARLARRATVPARDGREMRAGILSRN